MSKNILSKFPEENKDVRQGFKYYFPILAFMAVCFLAMAILLWRVSKIPDDIEIIGEPIPQTVETKEAPAEEKPLEEKPIKPYYMTDDDIIAAVVMAEAGNQDLLGKTAVAATVLNRADYFGLTIEQVVSAENAYSWPYYGVITDECYRAVEIARENRDLFPETMMYFRTKTYHSFGEPYEQIGDHYFSYLKED
jgi:spore germination cell wall hydrolase CwlJ-like protein